MLAGGPVEAESDGLTSGFAGPRRRAKLAGPSLLQRWGPQHCSLNRPGSRGHGDRAIRGWDDTSPQRVSDPVSALLGQRGKVCRCRALLTEERVPVILEIAKHGGHIDRACRDRGQPGASKQCLERAWLAEGETLRLVESRIAAV